MPVVELITSQQGIRPVTMTDTQGCFHNQAGRQGMGITHRVIYTSHKLSLFSLTGALHQYRHKATVTTATTTTPSTTTTPCTTTITQMMIQMYYNNNTDDDTGVLQQ